MMIPIMITVGILDVLIGPGIPVGIDRVGLVLATIVIQIVLQHLCQSIGIVQVEREYIGFQIMVVPRIQRITHRSDVSFAIVDRQRPGAERSVGTRRGTQIVQKILLNFG